MSYKYYIDLTIINNSYICWQNVDDHYISLQKNMKLFI